MIATRRFNPHRRCGLLAAALLALASPAALAAPAAVVQTAPAAEVVMGTRNGETVCNLKNAVVPPGRELHLRVENQAETPLWFVAPQFFKAAKHLESAGFTLDLVKGGFEVAPRSTVSVVVETPGRGEYPFSCFAPGDRPNPASSGFIVVPPARS